MSTLAELRGTRELLVNLTQREVRGKYKRSVFGQAWSLLNPLAQVVVFTIVFSKFLRVAPDVGEPSGLNSFALQMLSGLLPWAFFAAALGSGTTALLNNSNLVKKVYFPREVLVAATVFALDVSFATELFVLLAAVLVVGGLGVLPHLVIVPFLVLALTAFSLGLALLLSVANVYFRDTSQFVGIALQVWFYLTPIIYTVSFVSQANIDFLGRRAEDWLLLNPMTRFVDCFRDVFYHFRFPTWVDLLSISIWAVVSLTIGYLVFRRFEGRLAEEL